MTLPGIHFDVRIGASEIPTALWYAAKCYVEEKGIVPVLYADKGHIEGFECSFLMRDCDNNVFQLIFDGTDFG